MAARTDRLGVLALAAPTAASSLQKKGPPVARSPASQKPMLKQSRNTMRAKPLQLKPNRWPDDIRQKPTLA
jgi:hypothetical protein